MGSRSYTDTKDKMMNKQDISFKTDEGRFNYRVGGVVINNDKVLLLTEDRFDFWYLPGGRAYFFETSKEALKREIHEELGEEPVIERILWTTECLYNFDAWNIQHHDLTFYYLISFPEDALIYTQKSGIGKEEFSNEETTVRFQWFDVDLLDKVKLVPHFLKEALKDIPASPEHLIIDELKAKYDA